MMALVYKSAWEVELEERPVPAIARDNQVLVRIRATGVCGTDLGIVSGKYHAVSSTILGHESAGEVMEVGRAVQTLRPGDRVVIDPTYYCGQCEMCRSGRPNHCIHKSVTETGVSADGTFTDYYVTEDRFLYKIRDSISYEEATLTEPLSCILTGIKQIDLAPSFRTVIFGAGPMGILYSHALASKGVVGHLVEISPERLNKARSAIPDLWTVHDSSESAFEALGPGGKQADLIVDTTGAVGTQALPRLANCGYLMLVGLREGASTFNPKEIVDRSLKIIGSIDSQGTFSTAHYLIQSRIIPAKKIITHVFPLTQYKEAFHTLGCDLNGRTLHASSQAIKVIIQS